MAVRHPPRTGRRGRSPQYADLAIEAGHLLHLVSRATETERLRRENASLRQQIVHEEVLSGHSVAINTVRATLKRVAPTGSRVLITGPAGVGKEVAARTIHQWSARANGPFVVVSAAMMTPERVEEELFGSEIDGVARPGLLEQAHGGTLFLDEIGTLPPAGQMKLLRVLETGRFARLGSNRERQVKVRLVSATNAELPQMIRDGQFREDLYYRLNTIQIEVPPLADRPDDILPLARLFLQGAGGPAGKRLGEDAERALLAHPWPGNVRELRNTIQRATLLTRGEVIGAGDLGLAGSGSAASSADEPDRATIEAALQRNGGVLAQAASELGLSRQALYRRLDRLGIERP
ncbi:MAG: sigma-54 dependent transcriptional regulator [Proteobacteria bacterium]|nr:sigma-54 dependent transcriptional regulator [Pseudomonadota bacterium]